MLTGSHNSKLFEENLKNHVYLVIIYGISNHKHGPNFLPTLGVLIFAGTNFREFRDFCKT